MGKQASVFDARQFRWCVAICIFAFGNKIMYIRRLFVNNWLFAPPSTLVHRNSSKPTFLWCCELYITPTHNFPIKKTPILIDGYFPLGFLRWLNVFIAKAGRKSQSMIAKRCEQCGLFFQCDDTSCWMYHRQRRLWHWHMEEEQIPTQHFRFIFCWKIDISQFDENVGGCLGFYRVKYWQLRIKCLLKIF